MPEPAPTAQHTGWAPHGTSLVAIAALVVSNLVPLFGVLFRDWSLHMILIMYWIESGIVGAFNVPKIAMARGADPSTTFTRNGRPATAATRIFLVPFFLFHYGLFWVVHGVFVFALPMFAGIGSMLTDPGGGGAAATGFGRIDPQVIAIGAAGLALSHGLSFFVNFVGRREYLTTGPGAQMFSVYGRVGVLHVTILGGAFLIGALGTPLAALGILVAGKTVIDIALHLREHRRAQTPAVLPAGG